ncbi:baseplate J/gp47 family protein [Burkholderia gladioli]|uniref:Baseplate J/gp47 family protein n=1 Tax=Burkholderia gladioli TaxID=28095 RepID=A0AB38TLR1_BURGA|nr:baseplate J/gp47 family protein [Burkholderia gladioli]UWX68814.1 baseplate J/gp47 family protein [Burkholderia gladioli]
MSTIPLVMTATGPVATDPTTLRQALVDGVAAEVPDYTANLPGGLIEDIASTDVGALVTIDQARVDAINSVTPYGANAFVLAQLGGQFGIPQGTSANASVYVVFSGPSGYVLPSGFVVGDGSNQYALQDGGVIQASGQSAQLFAVATNSGTFAIPAGTVNQIVTSLPSEYAGLITVTNPQAGTAATSAESVQTYRGRVLQAGQVASVGTPAFLKTLLGKISGVQSRLISINQVTGGWQVVCGGGDAFAVAAAMLQGVGDIALLKGSQIDNSRNVNVSLFQNPNTYNLTFVNPPQQVVTMAVTWNTTLPNFTAGSSVNQLAAPALQAYINSIYAGQPINLNEATATFLDAVAPVIDGPNVTTLQFAVTINGTPATPAAGTNIITSDPESYFFASATAVTVTQG